MLPSSTGKPAPAKVEKAASTSAGEKSAARQVVKSKQQRLTELLDAYMKDQITAEQYHNQRTKIITEP